MNKNVCNRGDRVAKALAMCCFFAMVLLFIGIVQQGQHVGEQYESVRMGAAVIVLLVIGPLLTYWGVRMLLSPQQFATKDRPATMIRRYAILTLALLIGLLLFAALLLSP